MMDLPLDFWTRPQPGGVAGLGAGAAVGLALSYYIFYIFHARVRFGRPRTFRWERIAMVMSIKIITAFCMISGAVICSLIVHIAGQHWAP
jgi:membrane associated rhomboid family serine protease